MQINLYNKNILLIAPCFFGYEQHIINELNKAGACVTFVNSLPPDYLYHPITISERMFGTINSKIFSFFINLFEKKIKNSIRNIKYDYFIVINGRYIRESIINYIKEKHLKQDSKSILYYWDSISVLCDDINRRKYFDRIFSFDNIDCEASQGAIKFLPLFYVDEYVKLKEIKSKITYDLATVGSFKFNRYFSLQKIKANNQDLNCYFYLFANPWAFIPYKILRNKYNQVKFKDISFKSLTSYEINEIYRISNAVLDIPMINQNGLTMRTFECLAMNKKIITTNKYIKNYDFYDPSYIYITDCNYHLPPKDWFENKNINWKNNAVKKYSIENWINNLLNL